MLADPINVEHNVLKVEKSQDILFIFSYSEMSLTSVRDLNKCSMKRESPYLTVTSKARKFETTETARI